VRQDIVVSKSRDDGYREVVCRVIIIVVVWLAKDLYKLLDHILIQTQHLICVSRVLLIVVVACRIPCPYDKIDRILQLCFYPIKGRID